MMQTLQQLLHINAEVQPYDASNLPLYLKNGYTIEFLHIAKVDCLLAMPKDITNLVTLRKQRMQLASLSGLECVLYFEKITPYSKRKMIEEGIPFIIEGKEVYLPFLGMVLSNNQERTSPKVEKISFTTQKLLLLALYEHWTDINLSETASKLQVSKMTITRCFNQIQAINLPVIHEKGKERRFVWEKSVKDFWQLIKPHLRNPIAKEYRLDGLFSTTDYLLGGMSALSRYSMLNDNPYPTYAIEKQQAQRIIFSQMEQVPENEQPSTILQILQSTIRFEKMTDAVDPVTAYLSLDETEKQDPRVEAALNEALEEYVYGSGH